jgi:hypothetical protein
MRQLSVTLAEAGYATAVWLIQVDPRYLALVHRCLVPSARLVPQYTLRLDEYGSRRRCLALTRVPDLQRALATGQPVFGAAPGPAWLIGLSPSARSGLESSWEPLGLRSSAYLPLRSSCGSSLGILGVAGECFTPADARPLNILAAKVAEFIDSHLSAQPDGTGQQTRSVAEEPLEDIVQPLTALLARVELARDLARHGDVAELPGQLAAVRDSAQRLAARAERARKDAESLPSSPSQADG